jgi:hypothetical protein
VLQRPRLYLHSLYMLGHGCYLGVSELQNICTMALCEILNSAYCSLSLP